MSKIKPISLRRFNAYCYVRIPYLLVSFNEIAWYEAYNTKLLGTIVEDTDGEFNYMILARDKRKIFRAWDFGDIYESKDEAELAMVVAFERYENDGQTIYEQGDEKNLPHEFLVPQVPEEKLHPYYKILDTPGHEGAKNLINEIIYSFVDVDGNYLKDFQTTGFDGRLWELYLYIYFQSAGFDLNNDHKAPDFLVSYWGQEFAIEAVTVNKSELLDVGNPTNLKEAFLLSLDYMPIKYGSSLIGKLRKKYWEKEHVKDKPLIIAVHDFHQPSTMEHLGSMTWSRSALIYYLYGIRPTYKTNEDGTINLGVVDTKNGISQEFVKIDWHEWKGKKIEAGFFCLPDAENISAVLFSNNGTLTTFNRMGQLAGLGSPDVRMLRVMDVFNHDPNSITPHHVSKYIDQDDYEEAWGDGLVMYHNPNAKHPVDINCFQGISHMFFDKDRLIVYGYPEPNNVLNSMTVVFIPKKE
ncbi:MAG: hypothetical protein JWQ34_2603 [Mucilaginibacter sp.]|uniref:hypothetical protein n=1 Tax=Mucilaginibacter sp. TaxID=1882438 RepID=UPI002617DB3E|nr:hypothetical protein [Mucilaginibacter sp.]MDB5004378.1 hypothetical protein [Mucilaginibacter sp.]